MNERIKLVIGPMIKDSVTITKIEIEKITGKNTKKDTNFLIIRIIR
jgi:hypothetical protein